MSNLGTLGYDIIYTVVSPNVGVGRVYWGVKFTNDEDDSTITLDSLLNGNNSCAGNIFQQDVSDVDTNSYTETLTISCPLTYGIQFNIAVAVDYQDGFEAIIISTINGLSLTCN